MIFADEQGMGDTFRIQQIDLAVFHEQFRAVTGADALQYKIGFPPDFPKEGCRPDAGTQEDDTAQEKKGLVFLGKPVSAPMIKCKKTPKKKCRFMAERKKKRQTPDRTKNVQERSRK